jgi:hypothetical protein
LQPRRQVLINELIQKKNIMRESLRLLRFFSLFLSLTFSLNITFADTFGDAYSMGQAEARQRLTKAQEVGCDLGIKKWADFSEKFLKSKKRPSQKAMLAS